MSERHVELCGRRCLLAAGLFGASGVLLGAFHAHGLEAWLGQRLTDPQIVEARMHNAGVAVQYQLLHAAVLLAMGLAPTRFSSRLHASAAALFALGVIGFSGGLAVNVFAGSVLHWSIIPGGGMLLVAGWIAVGIGGTAKKANVQRPTLNAQSERVVPAPSATSHDQTGN